MLTITSPYAQIADLSGDPLDDGSVYIGTAGLNAETNPITVYWDSAGTQPAAQPIKTRSGVVARNGSPARVYTAASAYSITVRNKQGVLIASELSISSSVDASGITNGTISEVKLDAALTAKINGALQTTGGTMTGAITLPGNATNALEAAPKQQVESITAAAVANRMQYILTAAQPTTSGTAIDFTGIAAWAKRITLVLSGFSTNGTARPIVQIGSGAVEPSGYVGTYYDGSGTAFSSSFVVGGALASNVIDATIVLLNIGFNKWQISASGSFLATGVPLNANGSKTTSGSLDRVRLTTSNGTDTFDAGSVAMLIEG